VSSDEIEERVEEVDAVPVLAGDTTLDVQRPVGQVAATVSQKRVNPSWTPTPEMMKENPRLPRWVPGGHPMNPLGVRALYLGSSTYRIHGTDAPWTIGTNVSKGCIRMYNQDVLDLYPRVNVGTKVTVTYQNFAGVASSGFSVIKQRAKVLQVKRLGLWHAHHRRDRGL